MGNLEIKWSLYRHSFPNGKVYIGISQNPVERWDNGFGYEHNRKMFFDIVKFGWNNISHEILESGLTEEEARLKERKLIESYGDKGRENTYNTVFANYVFVPEEKANQIVQDVVKTKSSFVLNLERDDVYYHMINTFQGVPLIHYIDPDGIRLAFYSKQDDNIIKKEIFYKFPKERLSFNEAYQFFLSATTYSMSTENIGSYEKIMNIVQKPILNIK